MLWGLIMKEKKQNNGISLRSIHIFLVVAAIFLSGLMLYSTFFLSASFRDLTEKSEKHAELQNAAVELMDASDYLTEKVQRFAVKGDLQFLHDYYNEAYIVQHREDAINKMSSDENSKHALEKLQLAMDGSEKLMESEFYAIKLVVEAKGYTNVPVSIDDIDISEEDEKLSAEEKMKRAAEIVFSNDYYAQKYHIHDNIQACLDELNEHINEADNKALDAVRERLNALRVVIVIETFGMLFLIWLASYLGIHPIMKAVDRIKNNSKIPEAGTSEFRYLVRAYNRMYEMYKKSIESLNFKASHDELTGVYNRTGYETLIDSIELSSTYMLLIDIDNFKGINDTYGHDVGDKILIKLAEVLKHNFRPDDFICRLGGDEFFVFMVHSPEKQNEMIASKIEKINRELNETEDGLPASSISVGIVHGSEADKVEELLKKTDVAMYQSKQKGKHTYTFYSPQI